MSTLDQQERQIDLWTRWIATIGFTGLAILAALTMFDSMMRWFFLPRIPGFSDVGEVIFAIVIATCFPAGLLRSNNITIKFLGAGLGPAAHRWLDAFGSLMTLAFFSMLAWQFVLITADYQVNARVTETIELPIAPWWWVTTTIMLLCVPIQVWVLIDRCLGAIRGQTREPLPERLEQSS
ncbi:MAG: TRAP transporter small permease [Rhodospirillales bacterium]|nr:TRAP transporter small permease [Rhodospirillales bacterium]